MLERASRGRRIVIARAGKPVAILGPLAPASKERRPGLLKGRLRISGDFDGPLSADRQASFTEGAIEPE
ncbi:MAG: hypothetical protein OEZ06_14690 [Myxococcales bacterium]|nr:hypothetical protein [Myxococcales bacterium]